MIFRLQHFFLCAVVFFIASIFFFAATNQAHAISYSYYRAITVTANASIASGTNANFPMLVSSTVSSWKASSGGGHIQNLCTAPNGNDEPCDLVFTTSTACTSPLNFETESYVSSTGALVDWVNVPSLSAGTVIYACYDSISVSTDQSHPSSTWNNGYQAVWHMNQGGVATTTDSTINQNHGTNNGLTAISSGEIDGATDGFNIGNYINIPSQTGLNISNTDYTIEAWVNPSTYASYGGVVYFDGEGLVEDYNAAWTLIHDGNSSLGRSMPTNSIVSNTWQFIVGTASSGTFNVYDNGVLDNGAPISDNFGVNASYLIGQAYGGYYFEGMLDEVRASNVARSSSWILTEYNNDNSPATFYALGNETANGSTPVISSFSISPSVVASAGTSTLSWSISNASSVAITPGNFSTSTLIASTTVNPTSTIIYTLTATNQNGTSTATTTVNVATAPTAPGSVSVGSPTTSTLSLAWASSTPNHGASISFYAIYRGLATSTMPQIATTTSLAFLDTNLSTSTSYFYYLTAQDSVGNVSASSSIASGTTLSGIFPSITSFSALPLFVALNGTSTLSWTVANASSLSIDHGIGIVTGTSTVTAALTTSTTYTLTATNTNGTSTATAMVTVDATPPNPGTISIVTSTTSSVNISISGATDTQSGLSATPYTFLNVTAGTNSSATSTTTWTSSGLSPNTQYVFAAQVSDAVGNTASTTATSTYTLANVPTGLAISVDSNTQLTPSWNGNGNATGTEYFVNDLTDSTSSGWVAGASYSFPNLICNTAYTFEVKARNFNNIETAYTATSSQTTAACATSNNTSNASQSGNVGVAELIPYTLNVIENGTGGGIVTSNPNGMSCSTGTCTGSFNAGADIVLSALPSAGSSFTGWGGSCSGTGTCEITLNESKTAVATFIKTGIQINPVIYPVGPANGIGIVEGTSTECVGIPSSEPSQSPIHFTFARNLKFGTNGTDVTQLQHVLISQESGTASVKLYKHGVTKHFGTLTQNALIEFQKFVDITPASGYFGPTTRAYVNKLMPCI